MNPFRSPLLALLVTAVVFAWPSPAQAQDGVPGAPMAADEGLVTAILAGALFDATGRELVSGVTILVRNGRIEAVETAVVVPADAEVIDLSEWTVLPGLISPRIHARNL